MNRKRYVFMDEAPGATGGGAASPAPPPAAATPAPAPAPQPGGTEGGGASALSGGAEWSPETVPEKYRVMGDDGKLDVNATFRKVDEHRASLEKRMGAGDVRPKTAEEYALPDTPEFKALGLAEDDAGMKEFRSEAHALGLSQKQFDGVMARFAKVAPGLVNGAAVESAESTVAALKGVFKDDFDTQMKGAFTAANTIAQKAGLSYEEVDKAIGNNPVAIRLFAALAGEIGEDRTPPAAGGATGGGETHESYIASNWDAYSDARHPKHKQVTERANALLDREQKGKGA